MPEHKIKWWCGDVGFEVTAPNADSAMHLYLELINRDDLERALNDSHSQSKTSDQEAGTAGAAQETDSGPQGQAGD
jgi:hypothetical protein